MKKRLLLLFFLLSTGLMYAQVVADFTASPLAICVGGSVQFTDASTGATSWSWTFIDGGSGQTSSLQNPLITYNIPGTYTVILTVTNGVSSDTEIKNAYITVVNNASLTLTSAAGSDNQNVCENFPLSPNITYSLVGATGVTFSGLPTGVSGSFTPSASGGTATISGTPTTAGVYNYTITSTGGNCAPVSVNGTITVQAAPTLTLTSLAGTDNQTVCLNSPLTSIDYTFGGSATGTSVTGLPAGVSSSTAGNITSITGSPSVAGSFPYTISTTGSACPAITLNGLITVDPLPTLTLNSAPGTDNQTVCENTAITAISIGVGGSATSASAAGLPPGVSGIMVASNFIITGMPSAPGVYNYTVTSSGGSCAPATFNGTITVSPLPTITLSSAAGTDNQDICEGSSLTNITYTIGGSATGATVSGLPAGVSGSFSAGTFTISGSPSVIGTFNYTVTTTGGPCTPVTATGSIQVDAMPTIVLSSAAGTDNQTVCQNSPITSITYTLGGSATGASFAGLPAGVSGSVSGTTVTISGSPTVVGTFNYTVTTTGGVCAPASINGTITVSPGPTIALSSAVGTDNQTICQGSAITNIKYVVGGSATGATASGLPAGVSGSFSGGIFTISGTPSVSGVFNYTVTTTGGPCTPATATGTIQIDATPTIVLSSAAGTDNQTVCQNSPITSITYTLGGSATGASFAGLPAGVSGSVSGTTVTISGSPTVVGTFNYTVTTTGGVCAPASINGTITVSPGPTIALSSAVGTDNQTICQGSAITNIKYVVGGSATGATASGLPAGVSGSFSGGIFTISGTPSVSGVFNYTVTTTGGPCTPATATGTIQIDATPTIVLSSAAGTDNQTVCQNSPITSITYTLGGSATGASFAGLPAGVAGSVSGTTVTISGSPSVSGTFNYTITTSGGVCAPANIGGSIVSDPVPTIALSSAAGTDNQTVCQGSAMTNITYTIGGSATGATVSGLPTGVTGSFSAGTFTISGIPTVSGTFPYTVTTTGGTCAPVSASGTIFVQSTQITLTSPMYSNNQMICFGNAISTITYDVGGPVVANDLPAGVVATYTPGSPNTLTISGTPTVNGSFYYTVSAAGSCGSNIVVGNIEVAAPITGNTSGVNTTVCEGSTFTLVGGALSSSNNPYTYEWESATSAAGPFSAASGINNASNYTGTADFSDPYVYFRRIVSNGLCSDTAAVVQITIDSLPAIVSVPTWSICSSDSALISGIVLSNASITSWSYTGTGQLLNPGTSTPTFVPGIGEAGTNVQIPFTVTSTNTCAPATANGTATITILPDPVANLSGSATVCASGNSVAINGASVNNGSFSWIHDGLGTLNGTGTLTPSYQTVLADTNSTVTVNLIATSGPGCTNTITDTAAFTIQILPFGINPAINAFAGPDQTISIGSSTDLSATGVAITTWAWSPSTGLSDSTIYNPTASPTQTTTYILTVTDINGCVDSDSLTVTVNTDYSVFIPNLFSPNNDGYNDTWEIPEIGNYPNTQVTIINREGEVVYENDAYDNSWDGKRGGKELPEATYYYLIAFANSDIEYKGAVTILRNKK